MFVDVSQAGERRLHASENSSTPKPKKVDPVRILRTSRLLSCD
jgi:hypothetical protein